MLLLEDLEVSLLSPPAFVVSCFRLDTEAPIILSTVALTEGDSLLSHRPLLALTSRAQLSRDKLLTAAKLKCN